MEIVSSQDAAQNMAPSLNTAVKGKEPLRLAAVYGPSYEALTVLGVEDRIVVRADVQTDDFPWAERVFKRISDIPALDNVHTAVNIEELMKYNPDMVYTFPRNNELSQLEKAGIPAIAGTSTKHLSDVKEQLMEYAETLNQDAVDRATAYGAYFDEKLKYVTDITDKISEEERPKVYYAGVDILTTYGEYSDIPEVIEAAGGIAVSKDLKAGSRTQIDQEQFLAWNPDYIFIDHGGMNGGKTAAEIREGLYKQKNLQKVEAVKQKQVYLSPSGVFYWDMGLQKILLVMQMAQIHIGRSLRDMDMERGNGILH
ncbi:MAG: ABC transporter substrate-binding protein [Muricomes sp.]